MRGLSLVAASGGHSSSRCAGLSLSRPLLLRSTSSRCASSVIVAHGPSCSVACGIFPDQGLNPCPLHWQADSQPLRHQGSPPSISYSVLFFHLQICSVPSLSPLTQWCHHQLRLFPLDWTLFFNCYFSLEIPQKVKLKYTLRIHNTKRFYVIR